MPLSVNAGPGRRAVRRLIRIVALAGLCGLAAAPRGAESADPAADPARGLALGLTGGFEAFQQGDYEHAREIWIELAEAGDAVAQFNLGKLYETGGGTVLRSYPQAARWYREAAAQGVAVAQNNLALMYTQGHGVPRDAAHAAELWRAAAESGYAVAQYNLALAYFRGAGVERNGSEASVWFRRAAENGLADAQYAMGQMARLGRAVSRDLAQALAWYELAAAQDHPEAAAEAELLVTRGIVAPPPPRPEASDAGLAADDAPGVETATLPGPPAARPQDAAPAAPAPGVGLPLALTPGSAPLATSAPAIGPPLALSAEPIPATVTVADDKSQVDLGAGYLIWLLSADSAAVAKDLWLKTQRRHETLLTSLELTIREMDHGDMGHYYRALAGPLVDRETALDLCRRLRLESSEIFCQVARQ